MQKWTRLASLGDVGRGFVVVGEECWVFCSRGPYSALVLARASARPGLILERLDQIVLAAEEARLNREGIAPPSGREAAAAAAAKRRRPTGPPTGIHPQPAPQTPRPGDPIDVRPNFDGPVVVQAGSTRAAGTAPPAAQLPPQRRPSSPATSVAVPGAESHPPDQAGPQTGQAWWSAALPEDKAALPEDMKEPGKTPGERTVWVLDADDLTKEFAGLIEDPDDPGRQG